MNKHLKISNSVTITCTPKRLWQVLTEPELIKIYLYGTETLTDWKIGSDIVFQGEYEGHKYRDHGKILDIILHEKIQYSYWSGFSGLADKPENYHTITYRIKSNGENCEFTWEQEGFADESRRDHTQKNMPEFLSSIKKLAEIV
ncbi:MAG: SRPBCC domain-containing protein [Sphingobacteriaceae bacterium]|nr:SRPBCC domain-containing protein [Sphingobacteriaceae bacterium]